MRLAPKGHARANAGSPEPFALCDCCSFLYLRSDLRWQCEYAGKTVYSTGFLHCPTCWNPPNPQGIAITTPPDPMPVWQPRPSRTSSTIWAEFSNPGNAMLLGALSVGA